VRIALLSEGLHPVVQDEWVLVGPQPGATLQVVAVPEAEIARARIVLAGMKPESDTLTSPIQKLGILLAGLGIFLGSYAVVRFTDFGSAFVRYLSLGAALVSVVLGTFLVARRARLPSARTHKRERGAA
jgi:hypothetical protein